MEATLLAAPIEFKRMLSWQLSAPTASPITKRKRKKKKQREDPVTDLPLLGVDGPLSDEDNQVDDDKTAEYAYIYVNSDGEEEVYYSAPESPLTSESDDESSAMDQQEQRGELNIQPVSFNCGNIILISLPLRGRASLAS